MTDTKTPSAERLPIKFIMPRQGEERKVQTRGGRPKPFRTVDAAYRDALSRQVSAIRDAVLPQAKHPGAVPVRVKLLLKALAKSHRPEQLFSSGTCPIVGAGSPGELFIKATSEGLANLTKVIESSRSERIVKELSCIEAIEPVTPTYRRKVIESSRSERIVKELSCIEAIEPVTPTYRRKGIKPEDVLRNSPRGEDGFITRVRLFNLGADEDQHRLVRDFEETCRTRKIHINSVGYSFESFIYGAECRSVEDVDVLSRIVGVRSLVSMPRIRALRPNMLNPKPLPKLLTRIGVSGDVPVVAVVDTGISDQNSDLETWVVGRESYVAPKYRNTDHGTFVAGLICWGNDLNPTLAGIDSNPCAVFDLQVIPNCDPDKGDVESLREQEFLVSLETALQQHANEFKVWNLSLGTDEVCSLD
jgi:hypothetical protein